MRDTRNQIFAGLFLCSVGWVCAGPAIGAPQGDSGGFEELPAATAAESGIFEDVIEAEGQNGDLPSGQTVSVGAFGQIDLHIKELELTQVLQLLSIQSQRNIIASRNVSGVVTADLYGVDFYDALDAILHANGYAYREKGNFIYVYTADELRKIDEDNRKLSTRVIRLNYLTAGDASTFITPLLSGAGSVAVSGDIDPGMIPSGGSGGANTQAHTDVLVVSDYAENIEEILAIIEELDTRPKQVLIEATILEVRLEERNGFGTDFSILMDYTLQSFLGSPLDVVDKIMGGQVNDSDTSLVRAIGEGAGFQSGPGDVLSGESTFKFGVVNKHASVFVRALDRVTDTTVVAKPKLLVLNRQRAQLLVGAKLGYISTTATETSQTQSVEFLEVGTRLAVRPFISDDGFVRMELNPSISDGTTVSVADFVIPNETTNEMTTNIIVRSGQTVVLGGLFKEDTQVSRKQVPFAGDIPILGAAFKGIDDSTDRTEVIFLVTPTVLKDESLYAAGEQALDAIELTRAGARQGLLPWSRSRMTSWHLRHAVEALDSGKLLKAKWFADLALHLSPSTTEALQVKERVTGDRTTVPSHSILRSIIDDLVDQHAGIEMDVVAPESLEDLASVDADASASGEAVAQPESEADDSAEVPADALKADHPIEASEPEPQVAQPDTDEATPFIQPVSDGAADPVQDFVDQAMDTVLPGKNNTTKPVMNAPAEDLADEPTTDVAVEEQADEPAADVVIEELADEPTADVVIEELADEPATDDVIEELADEPAADVVIEALADEPAADDVIEELSFEPIVEALDEAVTIEDQAQAQTLPVDDAQTLPIEHSPSDATLQSIVRTSAGTTDADDVQEDDVQDDDGAEQTASVETSSDE